MKLKLIPLILLAACLTAGSPGVSAQAESDAIPAVPGESLPATPPDLLVDKNPVIVSTSIEAGHRRQVHDHVMYGQTITVRKNEEARQVVAISGDAVVDGTVRHDVVVINGDARVNGEIRGDLVVVMGNAKLGPDAKINGEAVVIGGTLNANDKAQIMGERVEVPVGAALPIVRGGFDWLNRGAIYARPLPPQLPWVWVVAGVFFLIHLLLLVMFPQPARACTDTLGERPVGSFFTGILVLVLFLPFLILLAVSVVGILVIPFVICALAASVVFGKVVVYRFTGQQLGAQLAAGAIKNPLVALAVGTGLFYLLYMVPLLGFLVWGVVTLLGVGAVMLAAAQSFRGDVDQNRQAPTVSVQMQGAANIAADPSMPGSGVPDALALPRVGFWLRFLAALLDFILIAMLSAFAHFPPLIIVLLPIYHMIMWAWKGTTLGGIVFGLKLVRTDGRKVDFAVALVRALSAFFSAMVLFIGFFWAGWDRDRQSWHDKIAGTVIVRMPKGVSLL